MIVSTSSGLTMVLEILELARKRTEVADFHLQSRLGKSRAGMAYFDRMRVAEALLADGTISMVDGRLYISAAHIPDWLRPNLDKGDQEAWGIADLLEDFGVHFRKYESDLNARIGLNGEYFILDYLKQRLSPVLHSSIDHVSLRDDTCGYDIVTPVVLPIKNRLLIEVKTTVRPGLIFRFFLSRNEATVGKRYRQWCLVAVRQTQSELVLLGHLRHSTIEGMLPCDMDKGCTWESVRIDIPVEKLEPGLPGIPDKRS